MSKHTNIAKLTKREFEIIQLVESGFTNNEIAEKLVIESVTVAQHFWNIKYKAGVALHCSSRGSRKSLVQSCIEKGLYMPDKIARLGGVA